jgi:hypothetical protein
MNKRKLIGAVLIVMALIVMLLPAAEADAETSASAFKIKSGELVEYTGTGTTVSVPDTVEVIGKGAFELNSSVEKIILPDSVKEIKPYAFWGCENLKTVVLGKGLEEIGDFAFTNCTGLETMEIPSNVSRIGIQAFAYCNNFEDITIPTEVTDIDDEAFDGDYLLNIHCETGSYADKYAQEFYEKQKTMTVYNTDTSDSDTGDGSESSASTDTTANDSSNDSNGGNISYEISGEVLGSTRVVGNQAVVMMQSTGLPVQGDGKSYVDSILTSGVASAVQPSWQVPERAHYRDEDLTEDTLSEGITEIGQFAYARSGLKEIQLPEGLEKIDYAAFYHCDNLTSVELPESVTEVADKAFAHTAWVENFMNGSDETEGDFLISGGVLIAYRGSDENVTIPEEVRVVADGVFEELSESVSMESAVSAPEVQRASFPFNWIVAAMLLIGGGICVFQRAR